MRFISAVKHPFMHVYQRYGSIIAVVALMFIPPAENARAGGGWVAEPGEGSIRTGYNWKIQPEAKRLDTEGEVYRSLSNMTHD